MNPRSIHMQDKKDNKEDVVLLSADAEKAPPMIEVRLGHTSGFEKIRYLFMVIILMGIMGAGFYVVMKGPDQVLYSIRSMSKEIAEKQ